MEKIRLNKFLRDAGAGSRRKVEELILNGDVSVNGKIQKELSTLVSAEDVVFLKGKKVQVLEEKFYYLLNKPRGYHCTHSRVHADKIVYDLMPKNQGLFTVGRLDKDTEGLLIFTNDGDFANKVIHPSSDIQKEYVAHTYEEVKPSNLQRIKDGTIVENTFVRPEKVVKLGDRIVKIVVKEGKKREVRILLNDAGLKVESLTRTKIGELTLGNLGLSQVKALSDAEKELIFSVGKK
jgi:23S rRNA pseudouridine2605 synthase